MYIRIMLSNSYHQFLICPWSGTFLIKAWSTYCFFNFLFLSIFSGATLSLWLCWRSQIWTLSNPGVDAAETLFWFLWLVARGGCPKSGWTSGYRAGMPSQKFRSHTRMFCFTAQLLFPPVLFCLSWHWLVFWIQRVSFDVIWNQLKVS